MEKLIDYYKRSLDLPAEDKIKMEKEMLSTLSPIIKGYERLEKEYKKNKSKEETEKLTKELHVRFPTLTRLISNLKFEIHENNEFLYGGLCEYYECAEDDVCEFYPSYYEMAFRLLYRKVLLFEFTYCGEFEREVYDGKVMFYDEPIFDSEEGDLSIELDNIINNKISLYAILRIAEYLACQKFHSYIVSRMSSKLCTFIDDLEEEQNIKNSKYKEVFCRDLKKLDKIYDKFGD